MNGADGRDGASGRDGLNGADGKDGAGLPLLVIIAVGAVALLALAGNIALALYIAKSRKRPV